MILHELITYEVLRVIWWGLLGVLLIGFALTDDVVGGAVRRRGENRLEPAPFAPSHQ